jgi:cytochrome c peroxidase
MISFKTYIFSFLLILLFACDKNDGNPLPENADFQVEIPSNFPELEFSNLNPLSKEGIELGRMLFYDPILSGDNRIACATCHDHRKAFTDALALSDRGISGNALLRHSPALQNLAWMQGLFWDGGSLNLESLSLGPLSHPDEMGQSVTELVDELNAIPIYRDKVNRVFGAPKIELTHILHGLAQFQRVLVSSDSKYDKYTREEDGVVLSEIELKGLSLYKEKCSSCHKNDLFTDNLYHNNGIDSSWNDISDEYIFTGRFRITNDSADLGKFKTPSLRNVGLTAPYMHDGRFNTLREVLDHYDNGVKISNSLDSNLVGAGYIGIELTEDEKDNLIAFLMTLSDFEFISNPSFAPPLR